ncbi:unnamed protein product [Rotaria sp. Silwood1]|nr:unnamed protein product [Rotaria sp. Silwood1]CAF1620433.1 unnamed protein product [Rotaria sp. Silwood1]
MSDEVLHLPTSSTTFEPESEDTKIYGEQSVTELATEKVLYAPKSSTASTSEHEETMTDREKLAIQSMTAQSSPTNRTFAPFNTPMYRRRQTLTILVSFLMPWFCLYLSLLLLRSKNWYLFFGFIAYLTWMVFFRKYPRQGGLKQLWLRRLVWWKWFADYFPIQLHKTCDLPADRSYIFGYHPHGIISLGAFCNFATEATGFEEKFPGIDLRLLTLKSNFRIPFFGFYLSLLGLCDASKESCNYILEKGNGNSLMLVLGGVKEILDARPSSEYILTLKNRKGFVKIGLAHGASIVPVFSFGENDLYEQLANPRGSKLRQLQVMLQKKTGYTIPFFKGRGIFQYAFGFLPNRRPIDTYVGEPIELPKLSREEITNEIIDKYHTQYMDALTRLFDAHKAKHGNKDATIKYVNADDY